MARRWPLLLLAVAATLGATAAAAAAGAPPPSAFNVAWLAPSLRDGTSEGGREIHSDAVPLGNGALTALAWPNASAGGVGIYVGHQDAMSSWQELFKIAQLDVALSPSPYAPGAAFFNATHDITSASLLLYLGGSSLADYAVRLRVWADANADALFVEVAARDPASRFSISATVSSVRPPGVWTYSPSFSACHAVSTQPDVLVDPLPPPAALRAPRPQTPQEAVRHASGARRPTRRLAAAGRLPAVGAFQPGSVVIYHRNNASDGLAVAESLTLQGLEALVATTPDFWRELQFGLALDAGGGPALARAGPATLVSAAPAAAFELRATVLAVQTDSAGEWLTELSALVAAGGSAQASRAAHEAWWDLFWSRSYIAVNMTANSTRTEYVNGGDDLTPEGQRYILGATSAATPAAAAAAAAPAPAAESRTPTDDALPVPDALIWLRASTLASTLPNGSAVAAWPNDAAGSGSGVSQASAALRPTFLADAFGAGVPGVLFDGATTFLENSDLATSRSDFSVYAVFRDDGSSGGNTPCCSGVVFLRESFNGIATVPSSSSADDDDGGAGGAAVVAFLDGPGEDNEGHTNVRGRFVVAQAIYQADSAALYVNDCLQVTSGIGGSRSAGGVMIGTRNDELGRFFKGTLAEVVVFDHALSAGEVAAMRAYFAAAYPSLPPQKRCVQPPSGGFQLSRVFALTRYVQAVQSRGTICEPARALALMPRSRSRRADARSHRADARSHRADARSRSCSRRALGSFSGRSSDHRVPPPPSLHFAAPRPPAGPIKFNGQAFVAAVNKGGGEPDFRDWGGSNWWQNTRMPCEWCHRHSCTRPTNDRTLFPTPNLPYITHTTPTPPPNRWHHVRDGRLRPPARRAGLLHEHGAPRRAAHRRLLEPHGPLAAGDAHALRIVRHVGLWRPRLRLPAA